ncbi:hypothetical protein ACO0LB_06290 [Undibacterium sp. SXout7W]|uniref:hypothetical protein n=1 Tax=Undibacterium sp. SXout7W TaxID=3413049 RepID=UPI003BEF71E0
MGRMKDALIEALENEYDELKEQWIRERLDNDNADINTPGWDDFADEYDLFHWKDAYFRFGGDDWDVFGKSRFQIFEENMSASKEILKLQVTESCQKNLFVMLHAHVVTAVEAYLSSTFIEVALDSEKLMRKLVETDPAFAEQKFSIKEIFTKRDSLNDDLRKYLKDLIFHDIAKVKEMYKSVFSIEFGKIGWLFKAVVVRHHCVHRAGYDKEGNKVTLTLDSIKILIQQCTELVTKVEKGILSFDSSPFYFWDDKRESEIPF